MSARLRIGDLFEVNTGKGLSYVQYVGKLPAYGIEVYVVLLENCSFRTNTEQLTTAPIEWAFCSYVAMKPDPRFKIIGNVKPRAIPPFRQMVNRLDIDSEGSECRAKCIGSQGWRITGIEIAESAVARFLRRVRCNLARSARAVLNEPLRQIACGRLSRKKSWTL